MTTFDVASDHDRNPFALRSLLESLFRHKKKVLACFLLVMLATVGFLLLRKREYISTSRVFVRVGRQTISIDPTAAATGRVLSLQETQEREIQTVLDLVRSRGMAESVVDTLGPAATLEALGKGESDQPKSAVGEAVASAKKQVKQWAIDVGIANSISDREEAIEAFTKAFTIEVSPTSSILVLQVEAASPEFAQQLLTTMVACFQQKHVDAYRMAANYEFFAEQTKAMSTELRSLGEKLRDRKSQARLVSIEGQREVLEGELARVESDLLASEAAQLAAKARVEDLNQRLTKIPERTVTQAVANSDNNARDNMRESLYQLQLQEADLLARKSADNPDVIAIREQVKLAKKILEDEEAGGSETQDLNPTYQQLDYTLQVESAGLKALTAKVAALKQLQQQVLARFTKLNADQVDIADIERELALTDANYRRAVESLEQARLDRELDDRSITNIKVVQAPTLIERPSDLGSTIILALGIIAGCGLGLSLAVSCDLLSQRVASPQDVEDVLGVPVVMSVGKQQAPQVELVSNGR